MSGLCNFSSWHSRLIGVRGATRSWLTDPGSLTRRIMAQCPQFSVRHLRQHSGRADCAEAAICGLTGSPRAMLREVFLYCGDTPVVFAHSVLPFNSLRGAWSNLGKLGNRPLGAALFANPCVRRAPLQYKRLGSRHFLYQRACMRLERPPPHLWARRSLFALHGRRILVIEVFLPALLERT